MPTDGFERQMGPVDLLAVIAASFRNKSIVLAGIAPIIVVGLTLFSEQTFIADTTVMQNYQSDNQALPSDLLGSLGSSLSFAGINLRSNDDNRIKHLKILTSRRFVTHFVEKFGLASDVFPERWDSSAEKWIPKKRFGMQWRDAVAPSAIEIYERFMEDHLAVNEETATGVILISMVWSEPETAADLCNKFIAEANLYIREIDVAEYRLNLAQLEKQYQSARIEQLKSLISTLMAEQIKDIALAMSQPEYAFKVIDPALPNDDVHTPNYLGVLIATLLLALLVILAVNYVILARRQQQPEGDV